MDFELIFDVKNKQHGIVTSSEHRAIGVCLTHEFSQASNPKLSIAELLELLLEKQEYRLELLDWVMDIEEEDVVVRHNSLCNKDPELDEPDVDSYLDWEMMAKCGKDDLIELVSNWLSFIEEQKR